MVLMVLRRVIYATVAVLGIAAIVFQMVAHRIPKPESTKLPSYFLVPDFKLTERSGKTVTLSDLRGKIWVANFFYAMCPGPCPVVNGRIAALQDELLKNDDVRFVSISTDPDSDTPEVLRQYADRFHASDKWLFLTGDKGQIYKLSNEGFKLTLAGQKDPIQPILHSTKLALVDKSGMIRQYYDAMDDEEMKALAADVKKLLHE